MIVLLGHWNWRGGGTMGKRAKIHTFLAWLLDDYLAPRCAPPNARAHLFLILHIYSRASSRCWLLG